MRTDMIVVPLATLVIGGALGYCLKEGSVVLPDEPIVRTEIKEVRVKSDDSAKLAELQRQVELLQRQLKVAAERKVEEEAEPPAEEPQVASSPRVVPLDWMDRIRKEEPERYMAITNHFAEMGRRMRERDRTNFEFLDSLDLSVLGDRDREVVANHKRLLERRNDLVQQLETAEPEDRMALGAEFGEVMMAVGQSNGSVREVLIKETAAELGLRGSELNDVTSSIMEIIQATENSGPRFFRGGGPGGNRGGRGGRGGFGGRR